MKDLKYSRQREAILDNLKSRVDHPTADMLFQSLRKDDPKISLGTVYRNLGLLTEIGKIKKISDINGIERYDYNTTDHYHFACKACSKLIDLPADTIVGLICSSIMISELWRVIRSSYMDIVRNVIKRCSILIQKKRYSF